MISIICKYADNRVKVYATAVAFILTALVSASLLGTDLTKNLILGSTIVLISLYTFYCKHSNLLLLDDEFFASAAAKKGTADDLSKADESA